VTCAWEPIDPRAVDPRWTSHPHKERNATDRALAQLMALADRYSRIISEVDSALIWLDTLGPWCFNGSVEVWLEWHDPRCNATGRAVDGPMANDHVGALLKAWREATGRAEP